MNRANRRRAKKNKGLERRRQREADERVIMKRKTDWALQLCLGTILMTMQDFYPDFLLTQEFFDRLNENIETVTCNSRNLEDLMRVIKDEYGFDIRRI